MDLRQASERALASIAACALLVTAAPAEATEFTLDARLESALASTYVFRGAPRYARNNDPSFQTTAAFDLAGVGPGTLGLTIWSATALANHRAQPNTQFEVDLTVSYKFAVRRLALEAGYVGYLLPMAQRIDDAHEVFAAASYDLGFAKPRLSIHFEPVNNRGGYVQAGVSKELFAGPLTLTPSVGVGLAAYDGVPLHLNDVTASLGADFALPNRWYITASTNYAYGPNPAAGGLADQSSVWAVAGVGLYM